MIESSDFWYPLYCGMLPSRCMARMSKERRHDLQFRPEPSIGTVRRIAGME